MKRIITSCLALFLICSTVLMPMSSFAEDSNRLYVRTIECPEAYRNYAKENISRFVFGTGEVTDVSSVSVGEPFSFAQQGANIYYFPVLCDGVITYLLRVYPNGTGGYDGAISSFLAQELETLAPQTSAEHPLCLCMEGSSIVARVGDLSYTLFTYPEGMMASSSISLASEVSYLTVDAKSETEITVAPLLSRSTQYRFIAIDCCESQPSGRDWCGAYVAAAILRSVGTATPMGHPTAEDVMDIIYPNGYTDSTMTTQAQLVSAAHEYDVYPIAVNYTLSTSALMSELDDCWPMFMGMRDSSLNHNHAVVLRGYDLRTNVWSIWNPVYGDHYESFPIGGTYTPLGVLAYNYTYTSTIYNWMCE